MLRRDVLMGGACVAAAGAAFALQPRRRVSLLGGEKLDRITPRQVADWSSQDVSDLAAPTTPDSLAAKLYGEIVERIYQQGPTGAQIMMLLAHGDSQTNDLQLHRPEVCYPAFGFSTSQQRAFTLPIADRAILPARQLVADAPGHRETVVYWTRLGDALPASENEQRLARLETSMSGVIADGLLARFSVAGDDWRHSLGLLLQFIPEFIGSIGPGPRPVFIGPTLANAMAKNHR